MQVASPIYVSLSLFFKTMFVYNSQSQFFSTWLCFISPGNIQLVWKISWLVLWSQSTQKDCVRAKNKLQFASWLFCTHWQVIKPQNSLKSKKSVLTQIYIKQNIHTNIKHKIFKELVPSVLPLLKKYIRLGHAGIVEHSVDLSI